MIGYTNDDIKRIDNDTDEYLKSIKVYIKCLIKRRNDLDEVMEILSDTFNDDYVNKYPQDGSLFNDMNLPEFNDWCEANIENYFGREMDYDINYNCRIN